MLGFAIRALQVVLLVVSAYLAYGTVSPLVGAASLTRPLLPDVAAPAETTPDLPRYEVINSRNLFRSPGPAELETAPPQVLKESGIKAILIGTLVSSDPERSAATLEDRYNNEFVTVRVGDEVQGAKVERIEQRRIVLLHEGRLEQLAMDDYLALARASQTPAEKNERMKGPSRAAREKAMAKMYRQNQEGVINKRLVKVVEGLRKQATLSSNRNERGIYLGLLVSDLAPGSRMAKGGVQNGDSIVAINGVPVSHRGRLPPRVFPKFIHGRPLDIKLLGADGTRRLVQVERESQSIQLRSGESLAGNGT